MKKILLTFNQLNDANGVARCAIAIANILAERCDVEVTLSPLYRSDKRTEKLLNSNVKVKPIFGFYFPGLAKILSYIPARYLYKWIFAKKQYDIEIAFQYGIATYIIGSCKSTKDQKKLVWIHGYDEGLKYRNEYLNVDKVVCVSKCNKDRLEHDLDKLNHVDYCYNPIKDKLIIEQGREPIDLVPNDNIQFVSVGRLNKVKGYERLIDCMRMLMDRGYECSLWIVGPGEEYDSLNQKIKNNNLENKVFLVGGQNNPHKYTSKADVFVCSSYTEGYSTACTEAILLGVPVISTPVSGSQEIIETAQCGLIAKDLNTDSLYEIMETVVRNPGLLNEWKDTIKETKHYFSQEARIKKLYEILGL